MNNPKSIFTAPESFGTLRADRDCHNPQPRRLSSSGQRPVPFPNAPSSSTSYEPGIAPCAGRTANTERPPLRGRSVSSPQFKLPAVAGRKRTSNEVAPIAETLEKRRRVLSRSRHTLDHFSFPGPQAITQPTQPPSPLFFSNSKRERPHLPPRFSSSEAAAKMLSRTQGEDSGIKTVKLARGTVSLSSPGLSTPGSVPDWRTESPEAPEKVDSRLLNQIPIIELLEQDARPTFVVDLGDLANYNSFLRIIWANPSLREHPGLLERVLWRTSNGITSPEYEEYSQFKAWALSSSVEGESLQVCLPSFRFADMTWSCSTLRKRLRVFSAHYAASDPPTQIRSSIDLDLDDVRKRARTPYAPTEEEPQDYFGNAAVEPSTSTSTAVTSSESKSTPNVDRHGYAFDHRSDISSAVDSMPSYMNECVLRATTAGDVDSFPTKSFSPSREIGFFDWTRLPMTDALPAHIQFARSIDWSKTALGPIESWSPDLRQMCNLIMASPHPAAMYWGDDLVAIYNEAYVLLAGQKHPTLMGQSYKVAWAEIWDEVKEVFASARLTGQATMKDDDCLFIKRNDYLEETYFSWSIIPMVGGDGTVQGLYNPAFEKTRRKIAERRMLTLREVGERTATARDVKGFWYQVLQALETNEHDTPLTLLYSVTDDSESDSSSMHSASVFGSKQCYLEGALGVPENHPCAPAQIELKTSMEGFGPMFREATKNDKPELLVVGGSDLPEELMTGLDWRGFGDPCHSVVVCPIHPTTGENILGFLVLGVNPRRPYDDDYGLFIQLLSRQLATSLASVVLFEGEIRRGQRAAKLAALDRIELSEQLAARTQEAKDNETRFTRMAEFSPAGLFIANSEGDIIYCNDAWFEITRVTKDARSTERWIEAVKEEDQALAKGLWVQLVEHTQSVTAEFRFKAPWEDRSGNQGETWVLFSAYPEKDRDGQLKSVFGTVTNISSQKWAEGIQKLKKEEAIELKRQQENFIDITSHEMRNPLSAILQCADEISASMLDFRGSGSDTIEADLVGSTIDAAQTIALCAQHQKRIVDDVLTLSKLDSAMLLVTPVDVQPLTVVQRALRMFEGELQTADIRMEFVVDDSFRKLGIDWVRIDPSRVLQVLINLTTNAIKFTTTAEKRTLTVTIAASLQKPSLSKSRPVDYFPTRSKRLDMTQSPDWGDGEEVYVQFAVQDTGRGLTDEEKKLLFLRFSQASPRTHVQYGGSGLGLFISRELTELQGGEIGVASTAGKGSTFAFYVKARRSSAPQNPHDQFPPALARFSSTSSERRSRSASQSTPKTRDFAQTPTPEPELTNDRSEIKVLIVEDNLVNQRVLKKQLANKGFTIHVANHGGEAVDRLRDSVFWHSHISAPLDISVVLMDQEMPIMDGHECTRQIRELERSGKLVRHVPIIGVTANARSEQIAALMKAGMDDVVSKPFRIPELVPKIEELAARAAKAQKDSR